MKVSEISVEYLDHMGSDLSVVNAARVSFHKQSEWEQVWEKSTQGDIVVDKLSDKDVKLINYLAKHNHWTPFGHAFVSLRIKAPIFVARQAVKHQVGLVWNEVSRRYVDEEPEFWFPARDGWRAKAENVKQGSSKETVDVCEYGMDYTEYIPHDAVEVAFEAYNRMLEKGVAPELARIILPLNTMTEWIWSGSLAAFSRVCKLRLDPHSQLEIQELAGGIQAVVEPLFPVSWAALMGKQ